MRFPSYKGPALRGIRTVVEKGSPRYPESFLRLESPPNALYVVGDLDALQEGLAVVGARRATPYGIGCAKRFAGLAAASSFREVLAVAMRLPIAPPWRREAVRWCFWEVDATSCIRLSIMRCFSRWSMRAELWFRSIRGAFLPNLTRFV